MKFIRLIIAAIAAALTVSVVAIAAPAAAAPTVAPALHEVATGDSFGPFGSVRNNDNGTGAWVRAYDDRDYAVRYDYRLCDGSYRFVYPGTQTDPYYDADCLAMRSRYGDQVTGIVTIINVLTGERLWRFNMGCDRPSYADWDIGFNGLERAIVDFARKCP